MAAQTGKNMFLISLLSGLAGAGIALLLAPRSGRETRERIRGRTSDLKERAEDQWDTTKERVDTGKEKAKDLKERLTTAAKNTGRTVKEEFRRNKNELKDIEGTRQSPVLTAWSEEV